MSIADVALLLTATVVGGAMNSVAGGGSFLVFPALVFTGLGEVAANATTTFALFPGSVASIAPYRRELAKSEQSIWGMALISLVGGIAGAVVLLWTPPSTFRLLVPWLLLFAATVFTFGGKAAAKLHGISKDSRYVWPARIASFAIQLIIAFYGGYFGAGIGILMLALLRLMGVEHIHSANAIKVVLASCINGVAAATFLYRGAIAWPQGAWMMVAGIVGGYFGSYFALKLKPSAVRAVVLVIAWGMTAWFFWKTYGG